MQKTARTALGQSSTYARLPTIAYTLTNVLRRPIKRPRRLGPRKGHHLEGQSVDLDVVKTGLVLLTGMESLWGSSYGVPKSSYPDSGRICLNPSRTFSSVQEDGHKRDDSFFPRPARGYCGRSVHLLIIDIIHYHRMILLDQFLQQKIACFLIYLFSENETVSIHNTGFP